MIFDLIPKPTTVRYQATRSIYARYWSAYGGITALLRSLYFHLAVLLTAILWGQWTKEGWWDLPLSVLPNVIGFSVGGYALLLSFGDEKFQNLMARAEVRGSNAFIDLCASFTHFVLMQFLALLIAIVAKGIFIEPPNWTGDWPEWSWMLIGLARYFLWFLGELVFIYALLCGAAATMRIYRLAEMFAKCAQKQSEPDNKNTDKGPRLWTPDQSD